MRVIGTAPKKNFSSKFKSTKNTSKLFEGFVFIIVACIFSLIKFRILSPWKIPSHLNQGAYPSMTN